MTDMTITYPLGSSLYVNVTNRCTNRCSFCIRNTQAGVGAGMSLWLEREPTVAEIIEDIEKHDLAEYKEIVFCGFGEPMFRVYDIIEVCKRLKEKQEVLIRINTNGHGNLIHGKDVTPLLTGRVDSVSISLNAKNAVEYQAICRSDYGEQGFDAMLDFAVKCKQYVSSVVLSVVDIMHEDDIKECEEIAERLGTGFRIRHYG